MYFLLILLISGLNLVFCLCQSRNVQQRATVSQVFCLLENRVLQFVLIFSRCWLFSAGFGIPGTDPPGPAHPSLGGVPSHCAAPTLAKHSLNNEMGILNWCVCVCFEVVSHVTQLPEVNMQLAYISEKWLMV